MFDDSLLDDPVALEVRGEPIRRLALTGARLRYDLSSHMENIAGRLGAMLPRAVLVIGEEARLVRAIIESGSPVPCVAWQRESLPTWTGPLDLVVILAGHSHQWIQPAREATRRGAMVVVIAPDSSPLLEEVSSYACLVLPDEDPFVSALFACKALDVFGLGIELDLSVVADTVDEVCDRCGPRHSLESNPAKNLACALADSVPLVWGESIVAARASRRIAEALRQATGVPALAAGQEALLPLVTSSPYRDPFTDPFEEQASSSGFCLLILDEQESPGAHTELVRVAQGHNQRVEYIHYVHDNAVVRYAGLLYQGLCAAAFLEIATMKE
ncbi:MAG: hypothetical protein FWG08_05655 [Propionibacteriaceae bacterium]|nr:hypothetical protein [Propionibacteriaceae bacterium]